MFIFLSIVSALIGAAMWSLWACGLASEYPGRVLGVAIMSTAIAIACALASKFYEEGD